MTKITTFESDGSDGYNAGTFGWMFTFKDEDDTEYMSKGGGWCDAESARKDAKRVAEGMGLNA